MRLHSAKVPEISHQMVHALTSSGAIETEAPKEVELDVQAVLNQYITDEQEVSDKAKDVLGQRGLPPSEHLVVDTGGSLESALSTLRSRGIF